MPWATRHCMWTTRFPITDMSPEGQLDVSKFYFFRLNGWLWKLRYLSCWWSLDQIREWYHKWNERRNRIINAVSLRKFTCQWRPTTTDIWSFLIIPHWDGTGCWHASSCTIRTCSSYTANMPLVTSSYENYFRITGSLWRESAFLRWIPLIKGFEVSLPLTWTSDWNNSRIVGYLRCPDTHVTSR